MKLNSWACYTVNMFKDTGSINSVHIPTPTKHSQDSDAYFRQDRNLFLALFALYLLINGNNCPGDQVYFCPKYMDTPESNCILNNASAGEKIPRNHSYIIKNRNFIKVGTNAALVASSTLILDFTNNFRILPETLKLLLIACSGRISFTFHMCNPSYFKVWANQSCNCCRSQTLPFLVFLVHSLSWFLRNS